MNQDTLKGQWKQLQGAVKKQWGKLTEDDLTAIEGQRDEVIGKIQERYGIAKEEAVRQWKEFEATHRSTYEDPTARVRK
jgi:uncharacterized protein YjbJ (UPF0337 family)